MSKCDTKSWTGRVPMASDLLTKISSELDARLGELRPLVLEYERLQAAAQSLGPARIAAEDSAGAKARVKKPTADKTPAKRATVKSRAAKRVRAKRVQRAPIGRFEQAVLDALEHGSHTVGELVMVTAMGAKEIRGGVRRLLSDEGIVKVERDGKTAYALPSAPPK
jgi:hypothetical protein